METFKYVPTKFVEHVKDPSSPGLKEVDVESDFSGHVLVKIPTYSERMKLLKEVEYPEGGAAPSESSWVDRSIRLNKVVAEHVVEVCLEEKATKSPIKTIDQLGGYSHGSSVINALGTAILNGVRLGENWSPTSSSNVGGHA